MSTTIALCLVTSHAVYDSCVASAPGRCSAKMELGREVDRRDRVHTGWARQTGQTCVLGGAPYSLGQLQKALVRVLSCMWHSMPITAPYATCESRSVSVIVF